MIPYCQYDCVVFGVALNIAVMFLSGQSQVSQEVVNCNTRTAYVNIVPRICKYDIVKCKMRDNQTKTSNFFLL